MDRGRVARPRVAYWVEYLTMTHKWLKTRIPRFDSTSICHIRLKYRYSIRNSVFSKKTFIKILNSEAEPHYFSYHEIRTSRYVGWDSPRFKLLTLLVPKYWCYSSVNISPCTNKLQGIKIVSRSLYVYVDDLNSRLVSDSFFLNTHLGNPLNFISAFHGHVKGANLCLAEVSG